METISGTSGKKSQVMRLEEFKIDERQYLKEKYPHLTEEQLDEILPALGAIGAGALGAAKLAGTALATGARLAGTGVAKAAGAAGRLGTKMGTAALKGTGKLATKAATGGAKALKGFGTTGAKTLKGVGKGIAKTGADIAGNMADQASNKMLKVGAQLPVGGQPVKVDKVQGDEVTFADPKNPNAPKTVVKKNSPIVKSALSALIPR